MSAGSGFAELRNLGAGLRHRRRLPGWLVWLPQRDGSPPRCTACQPPAGERCCSAMMPHPE